MSEARDERHGRDKVYLVKVRSGKGTGGKRRCSTLAKSLSE
nr:hypothetical protein [Methanophagales archaeon]